MRQQTLFKVRDLRQKTQFKIDDKYINGYARTCGANATLVYMSLCRHAEFESQKAFPSQNKIAFELDISVASVKRGLKKLIEYNIIEVSKEKMGGKFANNVYYLLDKSEWATIAPPDTRLSRSSKTVALQPPTVRDPLKDNKVLRITNNKDNKEIVAEQSSAGKEINFLIEKFKSVNPSYERLFGNTTQRTALERLVKKFGKEKVASMIDYLPKIFGKPYAPRITSPYQLEMKMADLISYLQAEKSKVDDRKIVKI